MTNKRVFLDTNILIEILKNRSCRQSAEQLIRKSSPGSLYVSTLTYHIVFYVCKDLDPAVLHEFLSDYEITDLLADDTDWARENARTADFEDALQIAMAVRSGCSEFITLDKDLVANYSSLPTLKVKLLSS